MAQRTTLFTRLSAAVAMGSCEDVFPEIMPEL
jgi:hypothetical protein